MEDITNPGFWLQGLGYYLASIALLSVLLKFKLHNSLNFRTVVLLVIWLVNIVFLSKSAEMTGAYYDKMQGKAMYYQGGGLLCGFMLSILVSWLMSVAMIRIFYNVKPVPVIAGTFTFPHIREQQFPVYVYRYYLLFVICLVTVIFILPMLVLFAAQKGYFNFIQTNAAAAIAPFVVPLMFVMLFPGFMLLNRLFRRRLVLSVTAYGISLAGSHSDVPLVSLLWTEIEGFRFKLSDKNGGGVLVAYAGSNTLMQLNCWSMPVRNAFMQPNELRSFTNFLLAGFDHEDIAEKFVLSWAIAADNVTEVRNKYYAPVKRNSRTSS